MLSLVMLVCSAQHALWSKPVSGLVAHIEVERRGTKDGSPKLVTYLTLKNVTDSLGTVDVYLSQSDLKLWLEDKTGKRLDPQPGGVNGRNGFFPTPFWLQIPYDSSIRMCMDLSGYFPPPPSEFVIESEQALLSVQKGWKKPVYLAGTFEVTETPAEARAHRFLGVLELPRILIFDGHHLIVQESDQ